MIKNKNIMLRTIQAIINNFEYKNIQIEALKAHLQQ